MRSIFSLILMSMTVFAPAAMAQPTFTIAVEDRDYSPYYTWEDGSLKGPCGEIAAAAFKTIGIEVEFVAAPWVRVIKMVEDKTVDAALCATRTEERSAYAVFPDQALLSYDATLFVLANSPFANADPKNLADGSFAVVGGYSFGGVDLELEERGLVRREATSRDSLIKVLLAGRVDMVLDSRLPMRADAETLGASGKIRALSPSLQETPAYLMFSAKDGAQETAQAFSDALAAFKMTSEYKDIATRYGMVH